MRKIKTRKAMRRLERIAVKIIVTVALIGIIGIAGGLILYLYLCTKL